MSTRQSDPIAALLDQQMALSAYFDALLSPPAQQAEEGVAAHTQTLVTPAAESPAVVVMPRQDTQAVAAQDQFPVVYEAPRAPARPSWGYERFQSLTMCVAGLTLAVPLAKLAGVMPWPEELTVGPSPAPWFLGLTRHQEQNVRVVDTAQIVLPASRRTDLAPAAERSARVVLVDEGRWGLACDEVADVLTLEPDDVRWRTDAGKRPWLAGTVREQLCALIDPDAFAGMLEAGSPV